MRLIKKDSSTKSMPKRFVLGFAALASAGVVGVAGLAGASPAGKPSKAECEAAHFKNYGQCVSEWARNKHSYDGSNISINNNVDIRNSGDDNFISVGINNIIH